MGEIYTVGHSNGSVERLIALLREHEITAIADVRSQPYSRFNPQFNREALAADLKAFGIGVRFSGAGIQERALKTPRVIAMAARSTR